jgi:hypothetical protein
MDRQRELTVIELSGDVTLQDVRGAIDRNRPATSDTDADRDFRSRSISTTGSRKRSNRQVVSTPASRDSPQSFDFRWKCRLTANAAWGRKMPKEGSVTREKV